MRGAGRQVNRRGSGGEDTVREKPTKTRSELEKMIMDELREFPDCKDVTGVAVLGPVKRQGTNWDRAIARTGASTAPLECEEVIDAIVSRLQDLFDLAP
jgi:hypothetical protein